MKQIDPALVSQYRDRSQILKGKLQKLDELIEAVEQGRSDLRNVRESFYIDGVEKTFLDLRAVIVRILQSTFAP